MGVNLNIHGPPGLETGGAAGPGQTTGPQRGEGANFQDNIVSLGDLQIDFNYTNNVNHPSLPTPNEFADQTPPTLFLSGAGEPRYGQSYYTSFSQTLEAFAKEHGLTESQMNRIIFAHMSGAPIPDDTFLNDLLSDIESKVAEEMVETFGEDAFPNVREQAKLIKERGNSTLENAKGELAKLQAYVNSLSSGPEKDKLQQFINQVKGNLGNLGNTLANFDSAQDRAALSNSLDQLNGQLAALKEQLGGAHGLSNDPNVKAALSNLVNEIHAGADIFTDQILKAEQNNQLAQGNWNVINSEIGQDYLKLISGSFSNMFEKALTNYASEKGLSEQEVAMLRFAHFNPQDIQDPKLKEMLNSVNQAALAMMSENWGIPRGFVPNVSNTNFNAEIELAYDDAVLDLIKNGDFSALANEMGLNHADLKGMLKFLHYNKELASELLGNTTQMKKMLGIDDSNKLQKILDKLASLQQQGFQGVSSQFGVPQGFQLNPSSINYQATMTGLFMQEFDKNLRNWQPPIPADQIAAIRGALEDPLNPAISTEIKNLIQQIYSKSVEQVRADYNLPVGWAPSLSSLAALSNIPANYRAAMSAVEQAEEWLTLRATYVDAMADSPAKAELLNFLKLVSEAIAKLKEQIGQMLALDSETATRVAEARKEAAIAKAEKQKEKLLKVLKKMEDMKGMNKFLNIFGPIMKVATAAFFMTLGPVGFVVAAAMLQDVATGGKENFMTKMFEEIMKAVPGPYDIILSTAIVTAMVMAAGPLAGYNLGINVFFENSGVVEEIALQAGASEQTAAIANMAAKTTVEVIVMAAMMIATFGTAGSLLVAKISIEIAKATAKALETVAKAMHKIGGILEKVAKWLQKAADGYRKYVEKMEALFEALDKVKKQIKITKEVDKLKYLNQIRQGFINQIETLANVPTKVQKTIEAFSAGMDLATGAVRAGTEGIQGEIALMEADFEAEIEELEALIKILKSILNKLFQGLQSQSAWLAELGDAQANMWSEFSQTASAVAQANEA